MGYHSFINHEYVLGPSLLEEKYGLINFRNGTFDGLPERVGFSDIDALLQRFLPSKIQERIFKVYSTGISSNLKITENNSRPKKWSNPLEASLPRAPDLKIYCFYGHKKPTELGYIYKSCETGSSDYKEGLNSAEHDEISIPVTIDPNYNDADFSVHNGIAQGDGDGSVPLVSLGFMCATGWPKIAELNPSNTSVITKEFLHEPSLVDLRGGPKTGDHVDILGNHELTMDILKIASDYRFKNSGEFVESRITSQIDELSDKVLRKLRRSFTAADD